MRIIRQLLLSGLLLVLLSACNAGYYLQAVRGHLEIMQKRQPIDDLLKRKDLSQSRYSELTRIIEIRDFASQQLSLPENKSYLSFVELGRPYPVWNVVATPEFSLKPRKWCFPVAGCVSYRGYFTEQDANQFAEELQLKGFDTLVSGVPAYSTLSWFADPALSSFSHWPATDIARLIFHELAHQELYLAGDSDFSEAFATSVELAGTELWLHRTGNETERINFTRQLEREEQFLAWADQLHHQLEELYASPLAAPQMRLKKQSLIASANRDYLNLKESWGGFAGYDHWLTYLNNARLASLQTYRRLLPAFKQLLANSHDDFGEFYLACKALAKLSPADRAERFSELESKMTVTAGTRQ